MANVNTNTLGLHMEYISLIRYYRACGSYQDSLAISLIRYSRACGSYQDFLAISLIRYSRACGSYQDFLAISLSSSDITELVVPIRISLLLSKGS
jgi:hypothetical protein